MSRRGVTSTAERQLQAGTAHPADQLQQQQRQRRRHRRRDEMSGSSEEELAAAERRAATAGRNRPDVTSSSSTAGAARRRQMNSTSGIDDLPQSNGGISISKPAAGHRHRLYSYLSGSDDDDHDRGRFTPPSCRVPVIGSGGGGGVGGPQDWRDAAAGPPRYHDDEDDDEVPSSPGWISESDLATAAGGRGSVSDEEEQERDLRLASRGQKQQQLGPAGRRRTGDNIPGGRSCRPAGFNPENVYSKINDTSTLPMPSLPPPPPIEDYVIDGGAPPSVPPRRIGGVAPVRMYSASAAGTQTCDRTRGGRQLQDPSPSRFDTTSFIVAQQQQQQQQLGQAPGRPNPAGIGGGSTCSIGPSFPRTVPRTSTLQRHSRSSVAANAADQTPLDGSAAQLLQHQTATLADGSVVAPGGLVDPSSLLHSPTGVTTAGQQLWRRQDRIASDQLDNDVERAKQRLKDLEDNWAKYGIRLQNTSFNANSALLSSGGGGGVVVGGQSVPCNGPTVDGCGGSRPPRFRSAGRRVQKQLRGRCSWKCVAVFLVCLAVLLLAVVSYLIAMNVHNLTWKLQQTSLHDQRSSLSAGSPTYDIVPTVAVPVVFGVRLTADIGPNSFWPLHLYLPDPRYVKINVSLPVHDGSIVGLYGRRNVQPTHARYDFFHTFDAQKISLTTVGSSPAAVAAAAGSAAALSSEAAVASLSDKRVSRSTTAVSVVSSAFVQYLESGVWYIFLYNDDSVELRLNFIATLHDQPGSGCPRGCYGRGDCVNGQCHCFPGFTGWDCKQNVCPMLCQGNGIYAGGQCRCHSGWKGKECELPTTQCEDPTCGGNGKCVDGQCICAPGFKGSNCREVDCLSPNCSGQGVCVRGECWCFPGFSGSDCALPVPLGSNVSIVCVRDCSRHGVFDFDTQQCHCQEGWTGPVCETELCNVECLHGRCERQRCVCDAGWTGSTCDQLECDRRCELHGYCNNGTCSCKAGWNGQHCSLDGCPDACNNHGSCQLFYSTWKCSCRDGWKGNSCEVAMEMDCENNADEDKDGLIDCLDPDCCVSLPCKESPHCRTAPDPMEILLRKQPPSSSASFYERMRFLIEDDSVQSYATLSSFNQSQVSVVRGKVIAADGSPLIGVRVSVVTQPLYGFTLTRELGLFDILVNGGGSVTLSFHRQPFEIKQTTVMVPWNRLVTMDTVMMVVEGEKEPVEAGCSGVSHDHYAMRPVVLSTWQHTQLGSCPEMSVIIPESQVLQESLAIPGTDIYLVYRSSQTSGYMSTILIQLTPDHIPPELIVVHLRVIVEGLVFERVFEADPGLRYRFTWDRRNAYNQKVYGIVRASVGVGYQYEGCSRIFWEMHAATMNSFDITSSEIGGWNLHIHHTYNFQEGILHKGDGTNIYLKHWPRRVATILGDGKPRRSDCRGCDGRVEDGRLMAPVALASGRDGSLYIGDYNFVRKLAANREEIANILQLSSSETPYKYFLTVSPLDGKLYISDHQTLRILRVKTMGQVRDLTQNYEVIAGTGEQCIPGDPEHCGDNSTATRAKLFYPKGIAINKDGVIYFADGANIRTIDDSGIIRTLIGSQGHPKYFEPLPCYKVIPTEEVTLHWPLSLAVNPVDNTLHILDNNVVLKVTTDRKVIVVAGRLLHCPPRHPGAGLLDSSDDASDQTNIAMSALDVILESPQHIAFSPDGELFVVESNGKTVNRVRAVDTDGRIRAYAGSRSGCNCQSAACQCFDPAEQLATRMLLNLPTAVTVTPDNVVHIADMGNLRVHSVFPPVPSADRAGGFDVLYPQTGELYTFNRYGQHVATRDVVTGVTTYNFTYSVNSYYGRLMKVTDSSGSTLSISRDYKMAARELLPPSGQRCRLTMDSMGQLASFAGVDNATTRFTYIDNSGLVESKENIFGQTFLYEYDANGRMSSVVRPTGERTFIGTEETPDAGTMRVSYPHDSFLAIEYPFKMAITLETVPHPLLSIERPLLIRRRIILPDNRTHVVEWRYYGRGEASRTHRSSLASTAAAVQNGVAPAGRSGALTANDALTGADDAGNQWGYRGRELVVNGENILTFDYDSVDRSQSILDRHRNEILAIRYDTGGRILQVLPRGPVEGLNITYDRSGRWTQWSRGDLAVVRTFDGRTGRIVEKKVSSRATFRYVYKNGSKHPTDVILPSGRQYQLQYDEVGGLRSVITPSLCRHHFHSLMLVGRRRHVYRPPGSSGVYVRDYDGAGRLVEERYPAENRRIAYRYDDLDRPVSIYHDWIDVSLSYDGTTLSIREANVSSLAGDAFACSVKYDWDSALLVGQEISFGSGGLPGSTKAVFRYTYDPFFRVSSVESNIGGKLLPAEEYAFETATGRTVKAFPFIFERPHAHREVVRDVNAEIVREFDTRGRPTDVWYRFNNHVVFTVETKYNALGQVHQWRRKVRSSDLKAYEYVYDVDELLVEVLENGQSTWRYESDADGNIVKVSHYANSRGIVIDQQRGTVDSAGDVSFVFDADGFLAQRGSSETFEFDSLGRLQRAHHTGRYDIRYHYDGRGRLVARRDASGSGNDGGSLVQFFYGDVENQDRITHVYNSTGKQDASGTIVRFFHNDRGQLFAMQRNGEEFFYIGLDPFGSPIVVLNGVGSVVKQLSYDPLGACMSDSAPDFPFIFGFRGGVFDRSTGMVFITGRPYDPQTGRWIAPGYDRFATGSMVHRLSSRPEMVNLYRNMDLWRTVLPEVDLPVTDVTTWLSRLGYNYASLVPDVQFDGTIGHRTPCCSRKSTDLSQSLMPVMSVFRCAFGRNAERLHRLSLVSPSVVVSSSTNDDAWKNLDDPQSDAEPSFATNPYIFGSGIILSIDDSTGFVTVIALESSHESIAGLVTTLLNGSMAVRPQFIGSRGRDVVHFVRLSINEAAEDIRTLGLRMDVPTSIRGLNVSVHRIHDSPDAGIPGSSGPASSATSAVRFLDVRIHGEHTTLGIRYGTTLEAERSRLLHHAYQRAVDAAWAVERERVQSGKLTVNVWTRTQSEQLVSTGRVEGFTAAYLRDVDSHPQLADWPTNVRFVPAFR